MVRDTDKITRKNVNTLLIIDVHARDIVDGFVRESVLNAKSLPGNHNSDFIGTKTSVKMEIVSSSSVQVSSVTAMSTWV